MSDRFLDVVCYLYLVGLGQGLLLITAIVLLLPLRFIKSPSLYTNCISCMAVFNLSLLFFGCIGNSLWMLLTYNHLYVSADTVVDYFPFIPFGKWVLDVSFGNF